VRTKPWTLFSLLAILVPAGGSAAEPGTEPSAAIRGIYDEALVHGTAFQNLTELVDRYPGRLSGSKKLEGAIVWATGVLQSMHLDRVATQPVMVPHWERGAAESVEIVSAEGPIPLTAVALGGSVATPDGGLTAEVVTVHTTEEGVQLGTAGIAGKIVFIDHPMDPRLINTGRAYGQATGYRTRGPAAAAKFGAVAVLTRSLTLAHDDIPHTGVTIFAPGHPKIPAAALSWVAADRLAAELAVHPHAKVKLSLHGQWFPDAPAANVIGEIKGSEFPDQVILVGGHLDSWDIAPGANDDGAGVVQSIEVLRIFQAMGVRPKHTVRCVLFVNEENGSAGAIAYAAQVRAKGEKHLLAMETDNGSFQPRGFSLGNLSHDASRRASRWLPLFSPYGITFFDDGAAGADVEPLAPMGIPAGELRPDSQRYFDYHHTRIDTLDHVNPRELELGAAAMAALVWLVDTQGL